MHRTLKQLIYGLIFLAFWAAIGYGVYFFGFKPAPTCFDGIQNQDEEGVDCGGSCTAVCVPANLSPIQTPRGAQVLTHRESGQSITSVLVELQNPNQEWAAERVPYTVTLFDQNNNELERISDETFAYAREVKYVALPNVGDGSVESAAVTLDDVAWTPTEDFRRPQLTVRELTTREQNEQIAASGVLVSDDIVPFSDVRLTAIFKGRFGRVLGVSVTTVPRVPPRESVPFSVLHPSIDGADFSQTEVFVEAKRPR